jgi:hypothetical protein
MIIVYDVVVKSKSPLCISLLIDGQGHRHDLSYIHLFLYSFGLPLKAIISYKFLVN